MKASPEMIPSLRMILSERCAPRDSDSVQQNEFEETTSDDEIDDDQSYEYSGDSDCSSDKKRNKKAGKRRTKSELQKKNPPRTNKKKSDLPAHNDGGTRVFPTDSQNKLPTGNGSNLDEISRSNSSLSSVGSKQMEVSNIFIIIFVFVFFILFLVERQCWNFL
jgi:hypothetical protein